MRITGNRLYDILDQFTGEWVVYERTTTAFDGTTITDENKDTYLDGVIYRELSEVNGGGYARRVVPNGIINVKWFGAVGDGSTDDTLALQKAFNSGRHIHIPKGNYKVTEPLEIDESGTTITGTDDTIITAGALMSAVLKIYEGDSGNSSIGNFSLSSLIIDGQNKATDGIWLKNARYNNRYDRITVKSVLANGFNFDLDCWINYVSNCRVSYAASAGIRVGKNGNAISIKNTEFGVCYDGIKIDGTGGTVTAGVFIENGTFQLCTNTAIITDGYVNTVSIMNNYFEDNERATIELSASGCIVSGNSLLGKSGNADYNIINKGKGNTFIANSFYNAAIANIFNTGGGDQATVIGNRIESGATTILGGYIDDSLILHVNYGNAPSYNNKKISHGYYNDSPAGASIPLTWIKGDTVYNKDPAPGVPLGWICTVSGTPGTWKPFGIIGAIQAEAQSNSAASDVSGLVSDFNSLLSKLRSAGLLKT